MIDTDDVRESLDKSLLWGLRRLSFYGELEQAENSDPHVRYEAKCHAKTTIGELARQCQSVITDADKEINQYD